MDLRNKHVLGSSLIHKVLNKSGKVKTGRFVSQRGPLRLLRRQLPRHNRLLLWSPPPPPEVPLQAGTAVHTRSLVIRLKGRRGSTAILIATTVMATPRHPPLLTILVLESRPLSSSIVVGVLSRRSCESPKRATF